VRGRLTLEPLLTGHATVLLVDDVRRALEYYRDALGFSVEAYDRIPDHYGYAARDGCHVHFARFEGVAPMPNSERVPPACSTSISMSRTLWGCTPSSSTAAQELLHGPVEPGYGLREVRVRDTHGYVLAFGQPL
jgi:catechol 2,3-dioxygenase-like lactoylglutathione lyase family enzyme